MYIVEGNIGVGKTTFLNLIRNNSSNIEVIEEPKDSWTAKVQGQSLLANFYTDTKRWAYTMETWAMICRVLDHIKVQEDANPYRVMERSIYSGHYCFAQNGYANGVLSELEWTIYLQWVEHLVHKQCKSPRGFIYLRANPETCNQRVLKRNRESEKNLTLEYLKQIHTWHERFLIQKEGLTAELASVPVLVLDCNEEFEQNPEKRVDFVRKVENFMGLGKIIKNNNFTLTQNNPAL